MAISAFLIILFVYTAVSKLLDLEEFESQLARQTLPDWSVKWLLWLIPAAELVVSLLLVYRPTRQIGFYSSAILMLVFTGYIGLVLLNVFDRVPCSCGGVIRHMGFGAHFVINLFFLVLSMLGVYMSNREKKGGEMAMSDF
jgi:putative oxidoreductase